ncbi:MAG: hypothetical protein HC831_23355 [Chloroflexia bacterium]|nr:hypothetical protein [Chloroflexia bacterium]
MILLIFISNIKASDQAIQKKILLFGLTTWFDPMAKNKKQKGIKYPLTPDKGVSVDKPVFIEQMINRVFRK